MDLKEGDLVWFRTEDFISGAVVGIDQLGIFKGIIELDRGIRAALVIGEIAGYSKRMGRASGIDIIMVPFHHVWAAIEERTEGAR